MLNRIIIKKPLVNEKSMGLIKESLYTFIVDLSATKKEIEKEVAKRFSVDVLSVATITVKPKTKSQRTRRGKFTVSGFKKAIVKIKKGQKIPLFESASEEEVEVKTAEGEVVAKTKKSLLGTTKVKIEQSEAVKDGDTKPSRISRQQAGKEKGDK